MANLKGKVETEIELKCSADQYYDIWKTPHHVPHAAGDHIQGVDMHEGDWDSHGHGSIKIWQYTADGTSGTFKEKVELDDVNKSVTLVGLEGDVFKEYKSFKAMHHAVPKGNGCLAKLSIEYEKLNANVPPPNKYLNMVAHIAKDIDAHIQKAYLVL